MEYARISLPLQYASTSDRGQDSPKQTDLAWLIRGLLYGQIRNQKDGKKYIFVPLRGLKHLAGLPLSLDSSPNETKITVQSPALYKLRQ